MDSDDGFPVRKAIELTGESLYNLHMSQISNQLLFQRVRNRVIEQLEFTSSLSDVARFGAFEALNMVDDFLPTDYSLSPFVFNENEKEALETYLGLADIAGEATKSDIFSELLLATTPIWIEFSQFSKVTYELFMVRGRFPEDVEIELRAFPAAPDGD